MQFNWVRWFNGYITLMIKGKRLERFINLAVQNRMHIWKITRYKEDRSKLCIRLEDFFYLKPLLKETGCRFRILDKHGLPFLLTKVRNRYAFFGGFLAFIIMLFMLTNIIWSVEVVGTENISKQDVLELAGDIGIKQGKFTVFLDDPKQIQSKMLEKLPEASWIGFRLIGTKAQIRVVEKVIPEERQASSPRHIVATRSAVIHNIFATSGRPVVRVNDFVQKGDILISGYIGKEEEPKALPAEGKVEGEVWYETEIVVPIIRNQAVYTGEKHRNLYILLGKTELKIWGYGEVSFQEAEINEESWMIKWRDFNLPLGWKVENLYSSETKRVKINSYEALEIAKVVAKQDILSKMEESGYIKEEKVLHQREENDKVYIKMHIVAIQDIAAYEPIIVEGN